MINPPFIFQYLSNAFSFLSPVAVPHQVVVEDSVAEKVEEAEPPWHSKHPLLLPNAPLPLIRALMPPSAMGRLLLLLLLLQLRIATQAPGFRSYVSSSLLSNNKPA
jgi:hypothetical protein